MPKPYSLQQAYEIGKCQKTIIWLVAASLFANLASVLAPFTVVPYSSIIVGALSTAYVYRLAKALNTGYPILWALVQVVPVINLLFILIMNQQATTVLKNKGCRVGLMGMSAPDLNYLRGNARVERRRMESKLEIA